LYHGSWIKSKTSLKKIKPPLLAQLKLSEMELSNLPQIIRLQSKQNMKRSKRIRKTKSRQRNKTKFEGKIEELQEKKRAKDEKLEKYRDQLERSIIFKGEIREVIKENLHDVHGNYTKESYIGTLGGHVM